MQPVFLRLKVNIMRRFLILVLVALVAGVSIQWNYAQAAPPTDDTYGFATFWQQNGGDAILGQAITPPLPENGLTVQYFERARIEYHPETGAVTLGMLGRERTQWRTFPTQALRANDFRPENANYSLRGAFRSFWESNNGMVVFGLPISAAHWENTPSGRFQVQYFERAKFIHHPLYAGQANEIELASLGREVAASKGLIEGGITSAPVMYEFEPVAPTPEPTPEPPPPPPPTAAPAPAPQPAAPKPTAIPAPPPTAVPAKPQGGNKWIEVDLSAQWMYAYEGDVLVFDAPVTTGKDGYNTPTGDYTIYTKIPLQTMDGVEDGVPWVVPNVPHVMYFNGGVAFHGTYWHNLFGSGTRISHGCVNLPLGDAEWLYSWARIGTPVNVHY